MFKHHIVLWLTRFPYTLLGFTNLAELPEGYVGRVRYDDDLIILLSIKHLGRFVRKGGLILNDLAILGGEEWFLRCLADILD